MIETISFILNIIFLVCIGKLVSDRRKDKQELHFYQENDRLHDEELSTRQPEHKK